MKKLTAILLTVAMSLSLVACTGKGKDTKKTKKTKRTKKTQVETDETEEPTETPSESETPTETETETDPTTIPAVLTFDESLDYIGLDTPSEDWGFYAVFDKEDEQTCTFGLIADGLQISNSQHQALQAAIDADISYERDAEIDAFYADGETFLNNGQAGKKVETEIREFRTPIFRSDTKIFSFALTESSKLPEGEFWTYNYITETGERLFQDDVILDRDGFAAYFEEIFRDPEAGSDYQTWLSDQIARIHDGSLEFTMSYDAVNVLVPAYHFDYNYSAYKIPVIGHEELFNLEYFGQTPKIYSIRDDIHNQIIWDMDGDGQLDELQAYSVYDDTQGPEAVTLYIRYNDYLFDSSVENVDIISYGVDDVIYMNSNDGDYVYVRMTAPDSFIDTYVFKIENGKLTYIDMFYDFLRTDGMINPDCFGVADVFDTLGSYVYYNEATILSNNGMPDIWYNFWNCNGRAVTCKKDITGTVVSKSDLIPSANRISMTAGSSMRPYLYSPNERTLIVELLTPNMDNNFWVDVGFDKDEDWNITVGGQDIYDLFYDVMFWG